MYIFLGIFVVVYLFFRFGMNMNTSETDIQKTFEQQQVEVASHEYSYEGRKMHYTVSGDPTKPAIVFIHGSPGSWDAYLNYLSDSSLARKYRLISVDRLGYGKSDAEPEPSLDMQAEAIYALIEQLPDSLPVAIVGHSYGGPVCYRLAMMHPDRINSMLIIAGLASAKHEKRLWIQRPLQSKWLRWLMPPALDISNREIVPLKQELKVIEDDWKKIKASTTIIQGKKDMLVAYQHAEYAEEQLAHMEPKMVWLPKANHFILWTQIDLMKQELIELVDKNSIEFFLERR